MIDLAIRPVERSDQTQWRRLWALYLKFYETLVSEAVYETPFSRLLSTDANEFRGLLVCWNGIPVGLTCYLFDRDSWEIENMCYLQDLYVDEEMRHSRIGRALIEAVYAAADHAACPSVYWLTQHFNEAGRALYDRIGQLTPFIRYDRQIKPGLPVPAS